MNNHTSKSSADRVSARRAGTKQRAAWAACAALAVATLGSAVAEARENPLAGQPAVRKKREYRDKRFEISPTFESSISAEFRNTFSGGAKVEYHINDNLSVGGLIFYGTSVNTGLLDQIIETLPDQDDTMSPTPGRGTVEDHANKIPLHGGIGVTFTPWFGKVSLFGKAFIDVDVYVSGGFGFAITKNGFDGDDRATICDRNCDDADPMNDVFNDPRNDGPQNEGFAPGAQIGAGFHLYFADFMALDVSFRNYFFADNPSGLDFNADLKVDSADRRFIGHLFVGVGLSFFLPPRARISR